MYLKTFERPQARLGFSNQSINWGMHIAGLYETEGERNEIIFGFLKEGFLAGNLQLFCPGNQNEKSFKKEFRHYCPECSSYLNNSKYFAITTPKNLYYPGGKFSPWTTEENLEEFYSQLQSKETRNIRAASDMSWTLEAIPGIEHLMAYESRLNFFIPGKHWISICMYNTRFFNDATLMNVLRTHPFTVSKDIITQNPLYQDPVEWLKNNAPGFL